MQHYWPFCKLGFYTRLCSYFSDRDHIQIHYPKNVFLLIKCKIALERKLWWVGVSFFIRCLSGAAFSSCETALVIILQLQFLHPLFFLLLLFGFDWISLHPRIASRSRTAGRVYPHTVGAKTPADLITETSIGCNCVLKCTFKVFIFHRTKAVKFPLYNPFLCD